MKKCRAIGVVFLTTIIATMCGAALADSAAEVAFLKTNARNAGVKTVSSVQYVILHSGSARGAHPTRNSAVRIRYEVRYIDGKVLDNGGGQPVIFPLRALVPGGQVVLMMMRPGDEWEAFVPPELAYGSFGKPPAGRVLIFKVKLLEAADMPPSRAPVALSKMP